MFYDRYPPAILLLQKKGNKRMYQKSNYVNTL